MAYTVSNLITDAYYASGMVSREFETVSGQQGNFGLQVLNQILADKAIEKDMIPYYLKYSFNARSGVNTYFVPNLESADTLTFFLENVRYSSTNISRIPFKGSSRAENIQSLPFTWNIEQCLGGANISFYFTPQANYPIEIWGLFRLGSVTMMQDMSFLGSKAELGLATLTGSGTLAGGQFVVNGVDLVGTYATVNDLVNYINTGIIENVTATYVASNFVLTNSSTNSTILIATTSGGSSGNTITFENYSTLVVHSETFVAAGLDAFYVNYLKYCLAERLCTEYNIVVPSGVAKQLAQYQMWISKRAGGLDLSLQKVSSLGYQNGINYAQVNLGGPWFPG